MRFTRLWRLAAVALVACASVAARADAVDPRFASASWAQAQSAVTAMAWAPDGSNRLFVAAQNGAVRVIEGSGGLPLPEPFVTIDPVFDSSPETGLVGLAFDPGFQDNGYVYFFVTVSDSEQQIIRYTAAGNTGTDKTVVISGLPTRGANHNGGAIGIGADGKLYWAVGDNGEGRGTNADLTSLAAKVGRANVDGTLPSSNPFIDGDGPNADFTWARGFRNPFTLAMQPATGAVWLNVVGRGYEQVFIVEAGAHAGYVIYENDQPDGYLAPVISYLTNAAVTHDIAASGAARSSGVATFTTTAAHGYRRGQRLTIEGVSTATFDGVVYVASAPTPTSFTALQEGPDEVAGGGTASAAQLGGCITGGAFYEATQFPPDHHGSYFFGDFNSGNVIRAALSAPDTVERVDVWATALASIVDVEVGPDGALYTLRRDVLGSIDRTAFLASTQAIVISSKHVRMWQGGRQSIGVSLAIAPSEPVTVTTSAAGDAEPRAEVIAGASLVFTPSNWNVPQPVTFWAHAARSGSVETTFELSAADLSPQSTTVHAVEDPRDPFILATRTLRIAEGGRASFAVGLRAQAEDASLDVGIGAGDPDVAVVSATTLLFPAGSDEDHEVVVEAALDDDVVDDVATITLTLGSISRSVEVIATDTGANSRDAAVPDAGLLDGGMDAAMSLDASANDAGPTTAADAADVEAGADAAGSDAGAPAARSGCGCELVSARPASRALGWCALFALLFLRRRRRVARTQAWLPGVAARTSTSLTNFRL